MARVTALEVKEKELLELKDVKPELEKSRMREASLEKQLIEAQNVAKTVEEEHDRGKMEFQAENEEKREVLFFQFHSFYISSTSEQSLISTKLEDARKIENIAKPDNY